jgi:hypothetical protein
MKSHITISDDIVIKTGEPKAMLIEVEKTLKAREIAEGCGLFTVPKVLDFDESAGQAKFEFIPDLLNIRDVVASEESSKPLMRTIGASLAVIHKNLTLPEEMKLPLPQDYRCEGFEAFLHCDFGLANVRINSDGQRIVIIDWQISPRLGAPATYGTRFFDLMWFIYDLFYRPVGRKRYAMAVPAEPMAREFLNGYFETSDCGCDQALFKEYTRRFIDAKKTARKHGHHWKRMLQLIPSHIRLRKFINSADFNGGSSK